MTSFMTFERPREDYREFISREKKDISREAWGTATREFEIEFDMREKGNPAEASWPFPFPLILWPREKQHPSHPTFVHPITRDSLVFLSLSNENYIIILLFMAITKSIHCFIMFLPHSTRIPNVFHIQV
jgi:hypothetical protein